jgi:hypothetical protein
MLVQDPSQAPPNMSRQRPWILPVMPRDPVSLDMSSMAYYLHALIGRTRLQIALWILAWKVLNMS